MLSEFEAIESKYGSEKGADLRHACRYLLQNQFAYAGDRGANTPYNTLVDPKFRTEVDNFFDCIGLEVHRQPEEQWVGILPQPDEVKSLPRIGISDTVILLTLAAFWQEKVDQGSVEDRAVVVTTLNELYDRYREMNQAVSHDLPVAQFENALEFARGRGLIWKGDLDVEMEDKEIRIRPMIKLVTGSDALKRIEEFVRGEERQMVVRKAAADREAADTAATADTESSEGEVIH
jgi:hypothetical protein